MSVKAAGVGHFQIPTAPAAPTAVAQSASANTLGSAVSFGNAPSALYITGVFVGAATTQTPTYIQIQILVGGSVVTSVLVPYGVSSAAASSVLTGYRPISPPIPVANAAAITVKSASSVASAVNWGVSLECIAQANVVDDGVAQSANVTQWNGSAVSAPAAAGIPDVNVKNINNVAAATPGASGGILISGTNAGTTTLGALTITGATIHTGTTTIRGTWSCRTVLRSRRRARATAPASTSPATAPARRSSSSLARRASVSASLGGGTSGDGIKVTTTSGHGVNLAPVGTSMHGCLATGGNGGTSDGIKAAAGTGGVDLRAAITGNITGNLSGSAGSVTGAVGSVTGAVGSVTGAVGSVTGAVGSVTGNVGGNVVGSVASVTGLTAANLDVAVSTRLATAGYTVPPTAVQNRQEMDSNSLGLSAIFARTDVATSTRLAAASYTAPDNASITAIKGKTDSLTFTVPGYATATCAM
jgi:hypothetical protein